MTSPQVETPDQDALRAFLSGKRRSDRRAVAHPVELHGNGQRVGGRSVDVSEGGALVRIPDDGVDLAPERPGLLDVLRVVEEHFRSRVEVVFPTVGVRVGAELLRLSAPPGDASGFLLGCRFERALTAEELARLLPGATVPGGPLSSEPKPGATVQALLFVEAPGVVGPALAGCVVGLDVKSLDVRADSGAATSAEGVAGLLRDRAARVRLTERGRPLWECAVRVVATAAAAPPARGVDVRVEADAAWGRTVADRFRRRR